MRPLRDMPIRHKLTCVTMLAVTAALTVAAGSLSAFDYMTFRRSIMRNLETHADIVGNNSIAALSFNDAKDAAADLGSLRADIHIVAAGLYPPTGDVLASYFRDGPVTMPARDQLQFSTARLGDGYIEVARDVKLNNTLVGKVYIRSDTSQLASRIRNYAVVVLAVFGFSSAIALIFLARLQRYISQPILHLTETAKVITGAKNYGIRAEKHGEDELGQLIDCFNDMLIEIQARDRQLQDNRDHLESQVSARTEELRSVNSHLESARDKAEAASRAKTAFLANMSHEIRTPMTAILGYADVMLEPDRTQSDRQDCLQVIRRNARHLLELINDILDISKIEAEKMVLDRLPCDLPQLVSEVSSLLRPRAMEKGLEFHVQFNGAIPREIRTDALRIKQVLINLLGNSIKFSPKGSITFSISCQPAGEESIVRFDVTDTGIGMTEAQIGRLFQPFSQADESMTRKFGGTGLGLAISKRLAVLLGGDITVVSTAGEGSTFSVIIAGGPLGETQMLEGLTESVLTAPKEVAVTQRIKLSGRILLAEDGEDNQALISMHLRRAGAEVTIAANGRIAVNLARAQQFDLVLMDMQMPELDGYGATSELRSRGFKLPIIALTAHAMVGDRERCIQAGCTDYLTKPIDKQRMLTVIRHYLEQASAQPVEVAEKTVTQVPRAAAAAATPSAVLPDAKAGPGQLRSTLGDRTDVADAIAAFVSRLPDRVTELAALLESNNLAELAQQVSQLKQPADTYGFAEISTLAATVENQAQGQAELANVGESVNQLVSLIRSVAGYEPRREAFYAKKSTTK